MLKITQEAATLTVFALLIGVLVKHTGVDWRFAVAGLLLLGTVAVMVVPGS